MGMRTVQKTAFIFMYATIAAVFSFPASVEAALIARWKFDEGTGSTTVDSVNSTSGTFIKGSSGGSAYPTWSTDRPSVSYTNPYSLSFEGLQDGVRIAWPSGLNFSGTAQRSFSFWYKPTASGETAAGNYDRIMSWTSDAFEIAGTLGDVSVHRLAFYDGSWRDTGYNMTVGTWYNITFTYDGSTVKLYVDNTEKFSGSQSGRDQSGNMYIGVRWEGNEGINGIIDDVKVYDTALTVSQIENLTGGSDNPDTPPDSTAPTISAIASSTASTIATTTWTTSEAASTKVVYSTDTQYASTTSETDTSTRVTSHSVTLSSLRACTRYNFKVVSRDAANNAATSSAASFTTTGCAGGATPTSSTSTTITVSTAATSTVTDSNRTLSVGTRANFTATSSTVEIQIKGLASDTVLGSYGRPSNLSSAASIVFDVTALIDNVTTLDSFNTPVTISYTYTDSDVSGLNESTITMYHYHNSQWEELDNCTVDTGANTITCTADSFSVFGIFGSSSSSSSTSSTAGGAQPWCAGPTAPGWNRSLPGGGCGTASIEVKKEQKVCSGFRFTRRLEFGSVGEDVRALQKFLNCAGFAVSVTGPGSQGRETSIFADKTRGALMRFQTAYAKEILAPIGATKATGIFATYSQKKVSTLTD